MENDPFRKKQKSTVKGKVKKFKNTILRAASKASKKITGGAFPKRKLPQRLKRVSLPTEKEVIESAKFSIPLSVNFMPEKEKIYDAALALKEHRFPEQVSYNLPVRYYDNRIMLMPRDPWWLHTYWDLSENRIKEVVNSIHLDQHNSLKWALRVYDVNGVKNFNGSNSNYFFDLDINYDANSWYINVDRPEREWCVEIGFKTASGDFYPIARSNTIKTPYFGISSELDEEWLLPDEEYYKMLGVYNLGDSSLQRKKKLEEYLRQQISSPLASWGVSSLFSERPSEKDKFFLEVWTELILYGRTESDAAVTVEGKKVTLRPDGTFTLRYALPEGNFQYEVAATSKNKKFKEKRTPAVKRFNKDKAKD
ncbi:MAG: DUF4912 domain-containing protein [Candidatus Omnitrophota bacterium]